MARNLRFFCASADLGRLTKAVGFSPDRHGGKGRAGMTFTDVDAGYSSFIPNETIIYSAPAEPLKFQKSVRIAETLA